MVWMQVLSIFVDIIVIIYRLCHYIDLFDLGIYFVAYTSYFPMLAIMSLNLIARYGDRKLIKEQNAIRQDLSKVI
jgi:hypothetical protein